MESTKEEIKNATLFDKYGTPISIVLGLGLIAAAIYYGGGAPQGAGNQQGGGPSEEEILAALENIAPVTADDHIQGSANAEVVIVEYSDTECPFCKVFHSTLHRVVEEYDGRVAWVYRHFPLDQLHEKARHEAVALECAAEQGGNDAFWAYTDRLYEVTTSNDGLDEAELPVIAAFVGLDVPAFESCLASTRHDARIEAQVENAIATGGQGTPWSVIITDSGKKYPVSGAQPYEMLKETIEKALR